MVKSGIKESNLIIVQPKCGVQSTVKLTYSAEELRRIGSTNHGKLPPYQAIRRIKELNLNKRRIRLQKHRRKELRKCNLQNLRDLDQDMSADFQLSKTITWATVNARSMRNKVTEIQEMLLRHDLDFLVITETWISSSDDDKQWLLSQGFNDLKYNVVNFPREDRRGGGLAIVFKNKYTFSNKTSASMQSFEHFFGTLQCENRTVPILGVYHPPGSSCQLSDSIFIDQLLDMVEQLIVTNGGLVVMGDFNIHIK